MDPWFTLGKMGIMAQLETSGSSRKFKAPVKMVLKKSRVPVFLEEYEDELKDGSFRVDDTIKGMKILKNFDRMDVKPEALDRNWYWLSIQYGFGNRKISLVEILKTRKGGQRYIGTEEGWVDCASEVFQGLEEISENIRTENHSGPGDSIRISRLDLFRLQTQNREPLEIEGRDKSADLLKKMLDLKPATPFQNPAGLCSILRHYQELGVEWLHFLYENGFGGLLCDDMGLGKTHEVMAFLMGLMEQENNPEPFLVVCPTTVLSHWNNIVRQYAPALDPIIYHGKQRDPATLDNHPLILTSYGILRRDVPALETLNFSVAVFDEIQNLKNKQTQLYQSAGKIQARMKLGLTGTPIENRLGELKALMDLALPGYLGKDSDFQNHYVKPIENQKDEERRAQFSKLISPFTLRRKKKAY